MENFSLTFWIWSLTFMCRISSERGWLWLSIASFPLLPLYHTFLSLFCHQLTKSGNLFQFHSIRLSFITFFWIWSLPNSPSRIIFPDILKCLLILITSIYSQVSFELPRCSRVLPMVSPHLYVERHICRFASPLFLVNNYSAIPEYVANISTL